MGNDEPVAVHREVVQNLPSIGVVNHRANRRRDINRVPVASLAIAPLAMAPALGFVFRIKSKVEQRVVVRTRNKDNIAPASAVAPRRPSARNKFLAAKRKTAIAAVAGLHENFYFIDKQVVA
jgi:hypothetical protein